LLEFTYIYEKKKLIVYNFYIYCSWTFVSFLDLKLYYIAFIKIVTVTYIHAVAENIILDLFAFKKTKSMII